MHTHFIHSVCKGMNERRWDVVLVGEVSLSVYLTLRARKEPFCRDKHSTDIACRVKHNSETIRVSAVFTGHLEPRQWLLSPRHPDSASCATTRPHPLFSRSQAVCRKIKGARTRGLLLETKPRRIVIFRRWRFRFSYSCCWGLGFALALARCLIHCRLFSIWSRKQTQRVRSSSRVGCAWESFAPFSASRLALSLGFPADTRAGRGFSQFFWLGKYRLSYESLEIERLAECDELSVICTFPLSPWELKSHINLWFRFELC